MMNTLLQNEINRQMRYETTYAMKLSMDTKIPITKDIEIKSLDNCGVDSFAFTMMVMCLYLFR